MDRTSSACDAELFDKDDLEFRTITTILHALGSREKIILENFHVSRKQRPHLKILSALSSLLVRDHEILAILPKRSAAAITVFVGSEEDALLDDSLSSCSTLHNSIARNPGYRDPIRAVELLDTPVVEVGPDVFGFIQRNWFFSHSSAPTQTVACLTLPSSLGNNHSNVMYQPLRTS